MKRKTFPPFLSLFSIFSRSGRNGSILDFSPLSSLSFQKKRRRKGVEEGDSFLPLISLFFLSLPLLFQEKKKRRRTPFSLSLSPFGRRVLFSFLFLFFFLFLEEKEKEKTPSFLLFLEREKWEKKKGRRGKSEERGERKSFCPF